jgi:hypothetical protein
MLTEYFRSFAPDCNHGTWQGYGMTEIAPGRRIELWQSLLDGGHWVWFWEMRCPGSLNYAVCTSDLRVTNGYSALAAEEFPDIMGGLDRILIASTFTDDRIAVAYSYPSWLADLNAHGAASKGILEELGYQSIHMTLDDVAAGRMQKEGYRLLILQHTSCMSPEQMAGVQRFVESGGTALIVGRIGWRDLVGSPHDAGSLADALAGIDTAKITPLGKPMTSAEKEMPITVTVQSVGVLAKGADVLASASLPGGQSLPILTRRNLGKGKVLWLNSSLDGHSAYRTGGIAGEKSLTLTGPEAIRNSHFKIYETTLQESGISPRARLHQGDPPVFSGESWYYRSPSGRSLYYARYVRDGVEGKVAVRLSQKGHIYNLRTQQYVGQVDSFDDTFPAGRVQVYGILNYKVTGLAAKLSAATAKPGDVLTLSCDVGTEGGPADLHGIRVQMAGPDGAELEAHRTVLLARDGRAELTLPIALNQPAGRHTIRLMDCVSGAKTEVELPVAVAP